MGVICGIVLGSLLNSISPASPISGVVENSVPSGVVENSVSIIIVVAIVFYIVSYVVAKKMGLRLKTEDRKKISTNGIFPFMFLIMMFLILTYTGLHS